MSMCTHQTNQTGCLIADGDSPPIDTAILFSRCMGNVSFSLSLLAELEATGNQLVDGIVLRATSDEFGEVAETAHSLKGAAAILGAERLRWIAEEIETASRGEVDPHLPQLIQELRSEMSRCLAYIPMVRLDSQRPS